MYTPRGYQNKCHSDTMNYVNSKKRTKPALVVLPTGSGKSLNISLLSKDYTKGKILNICPSEEILRQNYQKFTDFGGEAKIYSASMKSKEMGDVTFATLGSIKNMGEQFRDFGVTLLSIDEAHLNTDAKGGMFRKFLDELNPCHLIGYSATPFRLKSYSDPSGYKYSQLTMMNRSSPKFFSNIVHVTQIPDIVKQGFWAPIEVYEEDFNPTGLILNSTGGEYIEETIKSVVKSNNVNNKMFLTTKKLLSNGVISILLFLDTVENCYVMAKALGPKAAVVEAKTKKKDRPKIIADFKSGKINVICCVSTLTTGFDFPELQVVMMGRPTNSMAVFYQIYGRLVRPFENKLGLFYDFCGNIAKFGRMENIIIEDYKDHGWAVFSGDRLITGCPMGEEPTTKQELDVMEKLEFRVGNCPYFEFGAHKNKPLSEVPPHYKRWAMKEAKSNMSKTLYELCQKEMTT